MRPKEIVAAALEHWDSQAAALAAARAGEDAGDSRGGRAWRGARVSRGRAVRFPAAGELPAPPEPVPVLGPVVFTLRFGGVERKADLSGLPCPQLVRPLAAALAAIGGDDDLVSTWSPDFCEMLRHLRVFARFAADRSGDPAGPFGLADLRPELLDAFEADLVARYGSGGTRAHAFMGTVIRLLRHAARRTRRR